MLSPLSITLLCVTAIHWGFPNPYIYFLHTPCVASGYSPAYPEHFSLCCLNSLGTPQSIYMLSPLSITLLCVTAIHWGFPNPYIYFLHTPCVASGYSPAYPEHFSLCCLNSLGTPQSIYMLCLWVLPSLSCCTLPVSQPSAHISSSPPPFINFIY